MLVAFVLGVVGLGACDLHLPVATHSFSGNGAGFPPDPTSAIGPTRFVELSNPTFTIWDRSGNAVFSGGAEQLHGSFGAFDPQIMWDPDSRRFYFSSASMAFTSREGSGLHWGFSRTDTPNGPADWCRYFEAFDFAGDYPDYPRLGTTRDFVLVGANRLKNSFAHALYGSQSDLMWFTKPPPGATCPPASSFRKGIVKDLRNADNTEAFTPLPARQVDARPTGWVLATHTFVGNTISVFSVTRSPAGDAVVHTPKTLTVAAYGVPTPAPESGTDFFGNPAPPVDTLDDRLTQAIAAVDPRFDHVDVWTAHSVVGGAGSEVRWYEIDPVGVELDQSGVLTAANVHYYNATIAPDRAVDGTKARFGSNMVLEADASSPATPITIVAVAKRGRAPQSSTLTVKTSAAGYGACPGAIHGCPWGDYSGTSPDPLGSASDDNGQVWATNELVGAFHAGTSWNFAVTPPAPRELVPGGHDTGIDDHVGASGAVAHLR